MNKGLLIIISGFSGAGKGTLVKKVLEDDKYALSISSTTRGPREGEVEGKHYFFTNKEIFSKMIDNDELIEWAVYCDNYYGTPKKYVMDQLDDGKDVILEIEIQGALKVKEQFPDSVLIFITAPSAQDIKDRLTSRGTESLKVINQRIKRAYEEIDAIDQYDYIVVNDTINEGVNRIKEIIRSEHNKVERNIELKNILNKQFKNLLEGDN